jgi:hypothetical protein
MVASTYNLIQYPCHTEKCKTVLLGGLVQLKYLHILITNEYNDVNGKLGTKQKKKLYKLSLTRMGSQKTACTYNKREDTKKKC